MKLLSVFALTFLIACNNNKSTEEKKAATNSITEAPSSSTAAANAEDIIGEWEMEGFVMDTNDNLLIDEEERKNQQPAAVKDYMKLNRDGTGLFTVAKMEGRYEADPKEAGGKRFLTWFDKADGRHRIGTIVSASKEELHIKEPGGNGLFVWKRK